MLIKVCGMRDPVNLRDVDGLGVDMIGFVFYKRSPRFVSSRPSYLPVNAKRVGVFVSASYYYINDCISRYSLDFVQLHGCETPEYCRELRRFAVSPVGIVKAIGISCSSDVEEASDYAGKVDYLLFESKCASHGGSGHKFDWSVLDSYAGDCPFILSGGLGPDDAERIKSLRHPLMAGIDLNSRFELSPAFKDVQALKHFLEDLNNEQLK